MSSQADSFLTPVGRLVMGDCFTPNEKDAEGNPLIVKNGPNAGQLRKEWFVGIAIDKADPGWPVLHNLIRQRAKADFPHLFDPAGNCLSPKFAWKIIDGDSQLPNSKMVRPCDKPGFPGCWVLCFSSGYAPKVYQRGGNEMITDPSGVQRGYYVRVAGSVRGNESTQQPGVFLNMSLVELVGFGEIIKTGPDAAAVFGGSAATYMPKGMTTAPQVATPAPATAPQVAPAPAPAPQVAPAPAPVPDPTILVPPPAPAGPRMTAKAGGASLEAFLSKGWTIDALKQHGYIEG